MAEKKIGGKIVLEGETQYRSALKNIKSEQAQLRSEMKLCTSTFRDSQNSVEALQKKHEILTRQIETQEKKVELHRAALAKSTAAEETAAQKVEDLQLAYKNACVKMDEMRQNSDTSKEALAQQEKTVQDLKEKLATAEKGYEGISRKTESYSTSLNYAEADLQDMQKELKKTDSYMDEAGKSTSGCAESIDQYGKEVEKAQEQTSVFGDVLKANLASEAIISGVKVLAEGVKTVTESATDMGTSFEASMSQVAATMGITAEEIRSGSKAYKLLSDSAKECGKTTQFSATEAADALNYLALAGYDAEKAAATLPKVLNLAAAGGMDLAYASDLVTDSMAALNMETKDLDNYIDEMAKTSQKSNTNVSQLGEATLVCAGTVSLTKQRLETMNAELGILANNGLKGAEGGTHLRNVLLSLSAPTDKAADTMAALKLQVADSNGEMRDLNDIMIDLNDALKDMSSTEKTATINKIFNKTDIAAVNALLKGSGKEFSNLVDELKNCNGAAENMAETLNDNLKGKVTILNSALEGLGISAYEIFDDDMKDAVDAATNAVGRLQDAVDNGRLGTSLNRMSQSMGEFAAGAIDVGEDALPVLIDGFTWILDNADLITAGITGIAAANFEMKTVEPVIKAVTVSWDTYKTANEGATVSQWLLNAAMDANPAGILITAITGLTAAVAAYIMINKDAKGAMDETTSATVDLVKSAEKLNDQYADGMAERRKNIEDMQAQAGVCNDLVDELQELRSKTNLTNDEQIRQRMIIEQLNKALPDLNLELNEQTGYLNMSTQAIRKNVDALMQQALAAAAQEDLKKIAEQEYEARKNLYDLEKQLKEQKEAVNEIQLEYNETMRAATEKYGEAAAAYDKYGIEQANALVTAQQAQADLEEQIAKTNEIITQCGEEYEKTNSFLENTNGPDTAAAATENLGDVAQDTGDKITGLSDTAQEAYEEMYGNLAETISDQMNLFEEFSGKAELSTKELLNNMQSQVDGISKWADNLQELADRGINQGLLQKLQDMGPNGASYVATFANMTNDELERANELWQESVMLPTDTAGKLTDQFMQLGENVSAGYKQGLEESSGEVVDTTENVMQKGVEAAKNAWETHSPSEVTKKIGQNVAEGFSVGIRAGKSTVIDALDSICQEAIRKSRTVMDRNTFREIGEIADAGLRLGLINGRTELVSTMENVCVSITAKAKEELSRERYIPIGESAGQGIASGISNKEEAAKQAIATLCLAVKKEAESRLKAKDFEDVGKVVGQGIATGISGSEEAPRKAVESVCSSVKKEAKSGLKEKDFEEIGKQVTNGLAAGITSGESKVTNAIAKVCKNAIKEAKKELDIHSPSKKFAYIGEMTGEGFITGWEQKMAGIDSIIQQSLPAGSIPEIGQHNNSTPSMGIEAGGKSTVVYQTLNIYAPTDNIIETTRKFKESQREAAKEW